MKPKIVFTMKLLNRFLFHLSFSLFIFAGILFFFSIEAYAQYSLYVGQTLDISPSYRGTLDAFAAYSDHSNDITINRKGNSATARIDQYFSGSATIECQYGYTYYVGSSRQHQTGHDYYTVTCKKSIVTLSQSVIQIAPGQEVKLSYSNSSGYTLPNAVWESDNREIITIDGSYRAFSSQEVTVKGIKPGECTIKFYGHTGEKDPECKVIVKENPLKKLSLSPSTLYIMVGKTGSFSTVKTPSDATTKITWESVDESIATVTSNGTIKGIKEGKTKIRAKAENGIEATGTVEIIGRPSSMHLPPEYEITEGFGLNLEPSFEPKGSNASGFQLTIEDPSVVEKRTSTYVFGKKPGKSKVTMTTYDGLSAETTIIVKESDEKFNSKIITDKISNINKTINKTLEYITK